jgi:hypothetical protein
MHTIDTEPCYPNNPLNHPQVTNWGWMPLSKEPAQGPSHHNG